jgi:hypothetical protein
MNVFSLVDIRVGDNRYRLRLADPGHPEAGRTLEALRQGPEPPARYHVRRDVAGRVVCDCPDFVHRKSQLPGSGPCKHGAALLQESLI